MDLVIFDIEWNQPTVARKRIRGLIGEIIQIGAIKVDKNMNIIDKFETMIQPVYYTKMNRYVKELTLITDEDLKRGQPIAKAISEFKKWCGDDYVLISWGPDDTRVLKNNLEKFNLDDAWIPNTYDAQLLFDDQEMQENCQWALNYALYHFNEKPSGAHNALADAESTALIMKHLDVEEFLKDEYFICHYSGDKYDDEVASEEEIEDGDSLCS